MGKEQKVVIITGASQGFGAGLVKAYRDRNYRVVANSRSIKPSSDPDILAVAGDVSDPATAKHQAIVAISNVVKRQALIMGFSDTFAVIGVILAIAAVALLLTRKVRPGAGAGAH